MNAYDHDGLVVISVLYAIAALVALVRFVAMLVERCRFANHGRFFSRHLLFLVFLVLCCYSLRSAQTLLWWIYPEECFVVEMGDAPWCWEILTSWAAPVATFCCFCCQNCIILWFQQLSATLQGDPQNQKRVHYRIRVGVVVFHVTLLACLVTQGAIRTLTDSYAVDHWRITLTVAVWFASFFYIAVGRSMMTSIGAVKVSRDTEQKTKVVVLVTVALCVVTVWCRGLLLLGLSTWEQMWEEYNRFNGVSSAIQLFVLELLPLLGLLSFRKETMVMQFFRPGTTPLRTTLTAKPPPPIWEPPRNSAGYL